MRQGVFTPQLKLLWHCDRIRQWRNNENIAPIMVEMDLTNRCQLKCDFCTFRYINDNSDIKTKVAIRAIKDMANMGVKSINFTGGGEPTLHKDFSEITSYAGNYGIDLGLFTNGRSWKKEHIETMVRHFHWVRISLDCASQGTFLKTKGVDGFDKVIKNINLLCEAKNYYGSSVDIGVGFVITPQNYREIVRFAEIFQDRDEIRYLQYKPMIDNCFESSHIEKKWWTKEVEPLLNEAMRINEKCVINLYKFNDLVSDIDREYSVCYGHEFCPCIGATGDVWVCTHLRNIDGYSFGKLGTEYGNSFKEIWESKERQEVIKKIDLCKCQKYCRNNEINKVLYQIKNPTHDLHENFI